MKNKNSEPITYGFARLCTEKHEVRSSSDRTKFSDSLCHYAWQGCVEWRKNPFLSQKFHHKTLISIFRTLSENLGSSSLHANMRSTGKNAACNWRTSTDRLMAIGMPYLLRDLLLFVKFYKTVCSTKTNVVQSPLLYGYHIEVSFPVSEPPVLES